VNAIENKRFDLVICGGSFAGLALARTLTALAPGAFSIAIVEQRSLTDSPNLEADARTVALTASVKAMLEVIGIWQSLAPNSQPILRIELTDSALDAPIRPSLLGFDASEAPDGQPTANIVGNAELLRALLSVLKDKPDLTFIAPDSVESFTVTAGAVEISLRSAATLQAKLLIAADGQNSALRRMAGIQTAVWPSNKVGIVATVEIERPHQGVARQHFLPAGPFAILPMTGNRVSIVWTEDKKEAGRILESGRETLLEELSRRMGPELGTLSLLSDAKAYPLTMTLAREFVRPRLALLGDAAHALHWIAGQGLNHGLKDVAALSETLIDAFRLGLDIGSIGVLKRYERWRRFDSATSAFAAAAINTLFSNDSMALRMIRSSGLRTVDRVGRLKTFFMKEAAGLTGEVPKLLKGQTV